jgi:hypothetical protein
MGGGGWGRGGGEAKMKYVQEIFSKKIHKNNLKFCLICMLSFFIAENYHLPVFSTRPSVMLNIS